LAARKRPVRRMPTCQLDAGHRSPIAEIPEKKEAPAPSGHGGGGMGDMY
jgi:hypothetical protein